MSRIQTILKAVLILVVVLFAAYQATKWTVFRTYVGEDEALMVTNKFGDQLPPDRIVVPPGENHYKGVQEELLGPGRYFINPVEYDVEPVKLTQIPVGDPQSWHFTTDGKIDNSAAEPMVGLVSCKQGQTPPPGMEVVDPGFKGLQKEVLTPGTYKINKLLYEVTLV